MATNRRFQNLKASKVQWENKNPILLDGEPGYEIDGSEIRLKIGDGTTNWIDLPYVDQDTYDDSELTTVAVGGLAAGSLLNNRLIKDIIKDITTPYIPPTFTTFTVNDATKLDLEVGYTLPVNLDIEWTFSDLSKVEDAATGLLSSNNNDIIDPEINVNLQDLSYQLVTDGTITSNTPLESYIFSQGYDNEGNTITSNNFVINWKGLIRYGVNSDGEVTTSVDVNGLGNTILTNEPEGSYAFGIGYPFILIPDFLDNGQLTFIDGDTGLNFAMDLQSNFDNTLPSTVTYNNGKINITYNVYRGEFFYNAATNIIIQ